MLERFRTAESSKQTRYKKRHLSRGLDWRDVYVLLLRKYVTLVRNEKRRQDASTWAPHAVFDFLAPSSGILCAVHFQTHDVKQIHEKSTCLLTI